MIISEEHYRQVLQRKVLLEAEVENLKQQLAFTDEQVKKLEILLENYITWSPLDLADSS